MSNFVLRGVAGRAGFLSAILVVLVAGGAFGPPAHAQVCSSAGECDDGQFCNGVEFCDFALNPPQCRFGAPIACNDGDPCTADFCDEGSQGCMSVSTPDQETAAGADGLCNTTDDNMTLFGGDGMCGTMDDGTGDGLCDGLDNCDLAVNPGQEDSDADGQGDACDPTPCRVRGLYALGGSTLYRVDPNGAAFSFVASGPGDARDVAVDPTETFVAISGRGANMVRVIDLTGASGPVDLSFIGPWGIDIGASLTGYVAERDGGRIGRFDVQGGPHPPLAFGLSAPTGLDVNAAETFAFVAEFGTGELSRVDLGSGAITLIASGLSSPLAVALNPTQTDVYVLESGTGSLSRVDIGTGMISTVTGGLANVQGLALNAAGTAAYVTQAGGFPGRILQVDLMTGAVTPIDIQFAPPFNGGLELSPRPPVVISLPDNAGGIPSASVTVPVSLDDVTGLGVLSADLTVTFNPAVVNATSVSLGSLTGGCTLTSNLGTAGRAVISVFCTSALSGSGSVAEITFSVTGARGKGTRLDITAALLNEGAPAVCPDDGAFVVPVDISGAILYYRDHVSGSEPSGKPVDNATVELHNFDETGMFGFDPNASATAATACDGTYALANLTPVRIYQVLARKTDDFLGAIDPFDAALNAQHVVGLITLTANQRLAADVTGNNALTSFDSARIAQFSVGSITQLPVAAINGSDWTFVPAPQMEPNQVVGPPFPPGAQPGRIEFFPIVESAENQDFRAVLYGDVSGNWQAVCPATAPLSETLGTTLSAGAAPLLAAGGAALVLPSLTASPGETIRAPIQAQGAGAAISFYMDLRYSPAVLRLVAVEGGTAASRFSFTANPSQPGRARLALFSTTPLGGDGEIAVATFEVVGKVGSKSKLSLAAWTVNEGGIPTGVTEGSVRVLPPRRR